MSLNLFSVRYSQPEVGLMYLLFTAHVQILSSQMSAKMVLREKLPSLYGTISNVAL